MWCGNHSSHIGRGAALLSLSKGLVTNGFSLSCWCVPQSIARPRLRNLILLLFLGARDRFQGTSLLDSGISNSRASVLHKLFAKEPSCIYRVRVSRRAE